METEREITEPIDLCLPDGRVDPDAVGWSRRPLHRANLRGWGRRKRWEYWGIVAPTHIVGLTVSALDYAGVQSVFVLDRASGEEIVRDAVVPLARGVVLPSRSGIERAHVAAGGLRIDLEETAEGTRLRAMTDEVDVDVVALRPAGRECLAVVVPWSDRWFQYTVKDVGRPAVGRVTVRGAAYDVDPGEAFAVLDHGRGRWPYSVTWNWGAAHGHVDGRAVSLQLGGKWTDGTGSTENALLVDGIVHKISEELAWEYDRAAWTSPWRIQGETVDVVFHPFHERAARTNLLVVASETHQCFGHYEGWVLGAGGERVTVDGIVGWAEEARNRW
ncbi:MAG TPA: DUF2804 domain-containing protein [Candidatus Angelobacter sp.]|nr:DUF2804 domain-containing protein [Candidatus Angelobacter sp.]